MFKSLEEVKNHKKSVESKGLFTSIVYFLSPITGEVEERHIYADDNAECISWLNTWHKVYTDMEVAHYGYNCGVMTHSYLSPFEDLI